jgi:transposase
LAATILLRDVCGRLQVQVKQTTQAVNRLHNLLARAFPELATLVDDIAAGWVLRLLKKYPTAERIAGAHVASLAKIPHLSLDTARAVRSAARESVATLRGAVAEDLIRTQVAQVRRSKEAEKDLKQLLTTAFDNLPASSHKRVVTIPGIGQTTAAILVAKIVDINRFTTADQLVNYFGIFPEENSSGVDKQGNPSPSGAMCMSKKGNDLVRGYVWNAARVGIRHNPAIKALSQRLRSRGKRGDVAMGHCMRKLLHLVFAVWKTDQPFNGEHFPWTNPGGAKPTTLKSGPTELVITQDQNAMAVGHTRGLPARKVVTTATLSVEPTSSPVKPATLPDAAKRPAVDFAYVREQVTISQVLKHLGLMEPIHCRGRQLRGPCPIHGQPKDSSRSFSISISKNIFRCFNSACNARGNVLDLWAAIHKLPLYEAALHLAAAFGLARNREEEPVKTNPSSREKATTNTASVNTD